MIVNSFFSMCEKGSSVYSVCFFPLFYNNLNWVAYVQKICDLFFAVFDKSFVSEHILLYLRSCEKITECPMCIG